MNQIGKSASWPEGDYMASTADPNVSVSELVEEVPALTMATIIGVTLVMLVAIAAVFLLGVLIDWRQQRLINKKINETKRHKNQRRVNIAPEDDSSSITNNMEEPAISDPPAATLRNIP